MTRIRPCYDVHLTCEDFLFFFIHLCRWIINDIYRNCESWKMMEALFSRSPMVCKEHFLEEFCFSLVSQRTWESRTAAAESLLWPCGAWLEEEICLKGCLKACFFQWFSLYPTVQDMFDRHRGGRERRGRNKLLYIFRDKRWGIVYLKYVQSQTLGTYQIYGGTYFSVLCQLSFRSYK